MTANVRLKHMMAGYRSHGQYRTDTTGSSKASESVRPKVQVPGSRQTGLGNDLLNSAGSLQTDNPKIT